MAVLLVCHVSLTAVNGAVPGTPLGEESATDDVTLRGDIVRSIDFHGNTHFKKKVLRQRIGIFKTRTFLTENQLDRAGRGPQSIKSRCGGT